MDLTHRFTVPGPVGDTWDRFQDIASLAECFPGAQVTSVAEDSFEGTVKVKLGPIALVYAGSGTFVSKDDAAHTFVVEAKGRDKRGNGTAGATVTVSMADGTGDGAGSTDVEVRTDLSITGKPAQFGRGVMQDVSDKLLGQFVACLEQRSAGPEDEADAGTGAAAPDTDAAAGTGSPFDPAPEESTAVSPSTVADRPLVGDDGGATVRPRQVPPVSSVPPAPAAPPTDDALDLGATVLPVLVRGYWRQAAAGLAVVAVLVWLLRRLR